MQKMTAARPRLLWRVRGASGHAGHIRARRFFLCDLAMIKRERVDARGGPGMATCQLELLHVGVTVMRLDMNRGDPRTHGGSPPPLPRCCPRRLSPHGSDAQPACWPEVADVHTQSVCARRLAVSQAVSADGD